MKKVYGFMAASLIAVASFSAMAAQEVDVAQAAKLQSMGIIRVSDVLGTPSDINALLESKAQAAGAQFYRIIGEGSTSGSDDNVGYAQIYR